VLDRRLLGIYLNDHLAGSTIGLELARRARGSNQGSEYGAVLDRIAREIEEDREVLGELMRSLEIGRDRPKVLFGWVAEKVGRLKLNGRLLSYSPLSRLVELEALALGISGKLALWEALAEIAEEDPRLDAGELARLAERAARQRDEVLELRRRAARAALASPGA
jgi:hypothetical protein